MIHRIGGEIKQRPTATHGRASQDSPPLPPLKENARAQKRATDDEAHEHFSGGPQLAHLISQKQRDTNHQDDHSELVEPVGAQNFFHVQHALGSLAG